MRNAQRFVDVQRKMHVDDDSLTKAACQLTGVRRWWVVEMCWRYEFGFYQESMEGGDVGPKTMP